MILPLATGFLTKRAFAGTRRFNLFQQAGILVLNGLNSYISQNPEMINTISKFVVNAFHKKKKTEIPEE
jgi:hypothetical protein